MTTGQIFRANASDKPAWSTATYPDTAGTSGNVLTSDGTNWISSAASGSSVYFQAYLSGNIGNVTGDNTIYPIPYDTEVFDVGSGFDTGTGIFTAPSTGVYSFQGVISVYNMVTTNTRIDARLVTTAINYGLYFNDCISAQPYDQQNIVFSCLAQMTAGDTAFIEVQVFNSAKNVGVGGGITGTIFSGFKFA